MSIPAKPAWEVGVAVLAAGASARMGRPKLLMPWGDTTVLGHLLATWRRLGASHFGVVCAAGDAAVFNELLRLGMGEAPCIFNATPAEGMFRSVRLAAGWKGWKPEVTHVVLSLGDQPHVHAETLQALLQFAARHPERICQPSRRGHARHPIVLPRSILSELATANDENLKQFLVSRPQQRALLESEDAGLDVDLDRPEDYDQAWALTFGQR